MRWVESRLNSKFLGNFLSYIAARLLLEENAVLPGLGRFTVGETAAKWDPSENKIYPPVRQIEFERSRDSGDNSFLHYAAEQERIGVEEAISRWNEFASEIKKELAEGKAVEIPGLGRLENEPASGWMFTAFPPFIMEEEAVPAPLVRRDNSKVLPAGEIYPVPEDKELPEMPGDNPSRRRWGLAGLATLSVILLIMLFFILLHYIAGGKKTVSPSGDTLPSRAATIVKPDTTTAATTTAPAAQAAVPSGDSIHYNVVFATYHHANLAEKQLKKLQSWGHDVVLLRNDSASLFRLAVPLYTLPGDTTAELETQKRNYGRQAYIEYPPSR